MIILKESSLPVGKVIKRVIMERAGFWQGPLEDGRNRSTGNSSGSQAQLVPRRSRSRSRQSTPPRRRALSPQRVVQAKDKGPKNTPPGQARSTVKGHNGVFFCDAWNSRPKGCTLKTGQCDTHLCNGRDKHGKPCSQHHMSCACTNPDVQKR